MSEAEYLHRERRAIIAEGCGISQHDAERYMRRLTLPPGWTATPTVNGGWQVTGPRGEDATWTPAGRMLFGSDHEIGSRDAATETDLVAWVRQTEALYRSG